LVEWVGDRQVDAALLRLLSDRDDTAPVLAVAERLLDRPMPAALRVFAAGWCQVDDQSADWMADALRAAVRSGRVLEGALELLLDDDDATVRRGAQAMRDWLRT
jgi:hypothetical protein